jgi:signal transduction histidine kinase
MLESGTISIGDQARSSLAAIGRASQRMTRVIEDLLFLRKLGDDPEPLRLDTVDLGELVRDAVALTALAASEKRLRVEVEIRGRQVQALGEPEGLDKVVHNLVSNAVKYTPEDGWVHISAADRGSHVVLTVRDSGIGISPEDQGKLFTEFFRSTNPVAVAVPGTGLGLAIVRRIVERHHGDIEVESAPGAGSTFRVTLPAASAGLVTAG